MTDTNTHVCAHCCPAAEERYENLVAERAAALARAEEAERREREVTMVDGQLLAELDTAPRSAEARVDALTEALRTMTDARNLWKAEQTKSADAHRAAENRVAALEEALRAADDLLRRLWGWDMMTVTGDGPFWRKEIEREREAALRLLFTAQSEGPSRRA